MKEELRQQGDKLEGQKARYEELARAQQERHKKLAGQLEEFAVKQKRQLLELGERQHQAEQEATILS